MACSSVSVRPYGPRRRECYLVELGTYGGNSALIVRLVHRQERGTERLAERLDRAEDPRRPAAGRLSVCALMCLCGRETGAHLECQDTLPAFAQLVQERQALHHVGACPSIITVIQRHNTEVQEETGTESGLPKGLILGQSLLSDDRRLIFRGNRQHMQHPLGNLARRAARAGFDAANRRDCAADLLGEGILGEVTRFAALFEPRPKCVWAIHTEGMFQTSFTVCAVRNRRPAAS